MRRSVLVLVGLLAASSSRADVVYLKNGKSIEGKVTVVGDRVTVAIPYGSVSFPKSKVLRIEKSESVVELFDKKYAQLPPDDAPARLRLAEWCRQRDLGNRGDDLLREALEIDPDNAEAHGLLGHVRHEGKWVTQEEKYRSLGMVEFEGTWHKAESVAAIKKSRAEAERAREECRKAELELKLKAAEIEKLRAEQERLTAEREKLEAERSVLEAEQQRLRNTFLRYPHFKLIGNTIYYYPDYPECRKGVLIIRTRANEGEKKKEKE